MGTFVHGHISVWAHLAMGTSVCGHIRMSVGALLSIVTIDCGHIGPWALRDECVGIFVHGHIGLTPVHYGTYGSL